MLKDNKNFSFFADGAFFSNNIPIIKSIRVLKN